VRLDVTLEHLLKFPWSLVEGNVVLGENLRDGRELIKVRWARVIHLEPVYDLASGHQFAPFALELGAVSRRHMRAELRPSLDESVSHLFSLISCCLEEVSAFGDGEEGDDVAERFGDCIEASSGPLSQE